MAPQKPNSEKIMEQAYVNFRRSAFKGKRNERTGDLEGEDELPHRVHSVDAYVPMPNEFLPPFAEAYFDLARQKGFANGGNPILYVSANDTKEIKEGGVEETHNLVALWPAWAGFLEKRIGDMGRVCLRMCYFTKPVGFAEHEVAKDGCRVEDSALKGKYNSVDLFKMIKNANWNARANIFVERMSHDSTLPVGFLEAIREGHELGAIVKDPKKRMPLCEEASIDYHFDEGLVLVEPKAHGNLYPSGMYGGLSSPDMFDESKAPHRQPRAWTVLNTQDALRAERGMEGYDETLRAYFGERIPFQTDIQGKSLEIMIRDVFPKIIDSMVDFVEQ